MMYHVQYIYILTICADIILLPKSPSLRTWDYARRSLKPSEHFAESGSLNVTFSERGILT